MCEDEVCPLFETEKWFRLIFERYLLLLLCVRRYYLRLLWEGLCVMNKGEGLKNKWHFFAVRELSC